ncbi:two-component system, response regulator, stage 0 sporulation protein F [Thermosyntropha lipolytica DSM 11003]|uniref:Stage 0 sporulation protein A homolog n=1 Tax=Thermosyntropha lipolytica DSM 11003 TaxID=1123382 RepID=A0A1M5PYP4_9FIRM|nr:response regulator [Thermosyntropha lipolytica]SHH07025.1 two-component system, response regulator, stage 0 sporulation protein F [Thermosyntropha lipolytica DSM 11003]
MTWRILIADDQKGIRKLLAELFKRDGWEVILAENGEEAVAKAMEFRPNMVIMDMKMPNMNGLEAAVNILTNFKDINIIMMTAYGETRIAEEALKAGIKKCINKPFDIFELLSLVNEMAGKKSCWEQKLG